MKVEEFEKLEKVAHEKAELFLAGEVYAERIESIRYRIPPPRGFFIKKCPKCGKRLATKEYFCCRYYRCSCGYEYATEIGRI